ncbi:DUF4349 domain-containing protein [Nocardioides guangzhouensis]|nr:DUF4349 domain-containing protein [Nocardioides guangzhouensis]
MRAALVIAPTLLLAALVSGCSGGSSSDAGGDGGSVAAETADSAGGSGDRPTPARRTAVRTEAVIYTASVELHSDDVAKARLDVLAITDRYRGEVAEEETASGEQGSLAHARLVLRVPSEDYPEAKRDVEQVAEFGSSTGGREDVTTQVIDNESRIRAQTRGVRRLEQLIGRADDLSEVIALENQLTRRQADLDSLKQQQAYLTGQVAMATITVNIEADDPAGTDDRRAGGFLAGLEDGWHGLTGLVTGTLTAVGLLLPFAVLFGLLGVPAWLATRAVRRRRAPGAPPEAG